MGLGGGGGGGGVGGVALSDDPFNVSTKIVSPWYKASRTTQECKDTIIIY